MPDPTRSLSRAIALLRLLANHGRIGWRLSDLARQSGLDLATTHRLLAGLVAGGLATRVHGSRNYALGPFAWQLGLAAAPWFDVDAATHGRLRAAARALRGTLFLKLRSGPDSVCIARHDGVAVEPSLLLDVGGRRPLCQTAGGVAMLLALPPAEQKAIEADNLRRLRDQGRDLRDRIRRMMLRSRAWGFGVNLGDMVTGIQAISWPVPLGEPGAVPRPGLAALSLATVGARLAPDEIRRIGRRLADEAPGVGAALSKGRVCRH